MAKSVQKMNSAEYRELIGAKSTGKQTQTAAEWREMTRKRKTTTEAPQVAEIRLMLKLARIEFVEEFQFHPTRKWRFDFAIPEKKVAIEYEGVFGKGKSRHTTVTGYTADAEKYNAAALLGYRVLRYTAKNYKNVIEDLKNIL
jgi:very-short-patch-repair endonuclease